MEDDNVVAVGGLIRVAQCIDLNPAVKRDPGQSMTYHLPWNFLTSMQVMEYDRSFLASRILLDGFNGNLIISGASACSKRAWSSPPAAMPPTCWGRTWSWWPISTSTAGTI